MPTPKSQLRVFKDCFVVEVKVATGASVKPGQVIALLDSEDEDRTLSRIELAAGFLKLQADAISPEQAEIRRGILRSTEEIARAYSDYASTKLKDTEDRYHVGETTLVDIAQARTALARATAELKRASAALTLFELNMSQATAKVSMAQSETAKEKILVQSRVERLLVRTPVAGRVEIMAYEGAFLKKGDTLAEVS